MKRVALLLVLLFIFIALSNYVSAAAIGVNRAEINFKQVLKGGYAQSLVSVSTDSEGDLPVEVKVWGDVADWVRVEPEEIQFINRTKDATFTVIAEPPEDARNGVYTAYIRFTTGNLYRQEGKLGSSVKTAFRVTVTIEVTGKEIVSCLAAGFNIPDVEIGYPIELYSVIENQGNVKILPDINLDIWNQEQTQLLLSKTVTISERLLPTLKDRFMNEIIADLPIGQYWTDVTIPLCGDYRLVTFNVVEKGEISDKGTLLRIENKVWAETEEIIPITAVFRNEGKRVVEAKFKGKITLDGKLVKIIDTDMIDVEPAEIVKIDAYFQPSRSGRYEVLGRVLYNNKLTFEKGSILNVNPSTPTGAVIAYRLKPASFIPIIIVIVILVMLILIKQKKNLRR